MDNNIHTKEDLVFKLKYFSKIASLIVIIMAIIVLFGWIFDIPIFKFTMSGLVTMKVNTTIAFIFSGISLYLMMIEDKNHQIRKIAQICAFIAILIGMITLLEYFLNINIGIDELFFKDILAADDTSIPGRMSPISAFMFIFLGYALIFSKNKNHVKFTQITSIICAFIGLLAFIGYVYSIGPLYGFGNYTPIALSSTIAFIILSAGILFINAEYEFMGIITSKHLGGDVAQNLLLPAIVIPLLLGSLTLLGWKIGIYGVEFGISLVVLANIAIFTTIIWWSANSFNNIDIKRKEAENQLKEYHDHLEGTIKERTEELWSINRQLHSEIAERMLVEDRLISSLNEKDLLLKEVHHRVKNNMQIISSLLNLQSNYIENKEHLEVFKESQGRVKSMALVHEKLYRSKDFERIDFADYIKSLASNLSCSYRIPNIDFNINIGNISLDINNAIPCGLIINELVTNSFKHAFKAAKNHVDKSNKIYIEFFKEEEGFTLIVGDNGMGFPENLNFKNTHTLGLQLVNTLVEQLEGNIKLDRRDGTTFIISFKELKYKERI
ncbi:sensor histidine kinase [Methanobacterium oryzae]|uniref:sensor histidine kinase n=1 Tax=Methanobacterium oryzae TaxID=69540 RepID=UPI003D19E3D5